jgi:putative addiction module killer protein
MLEVFRYQTADGEEPVTDWLRSLRDKQVQAKVRICLKRLEAGVFGDCKPVGDGVLELREHLGAGYRVYFGRHGLSIVILLCGGSKKTQATGIKSAKGYWSDWRRRQAWLRK